LFRSLLNIRPVLSELAGPFTGRAAMLRALFNATQFLAVLFFLLALVVLPPPIGPHHPQFAEHVLSLILMFIIWILIGVRVLEIARELGKVSREFRKGSRGLDEAEPGTSPARLESPDKRQVTPRSFAFISIGAIAGLLLGGCLIVMLGPPAPYNEGQEMRVMFISVVAGIITGTIFGRVS